MDWFYAILIAIGMGFLWVWADQIKWISEGLPPKQKRRYVWILWVLYAVLMFGAITVGVVLGV